MNHQTLDRPVANEPAAPTTGEWPVIHRCRWCEKRVGHAQFYNAFGEYVKVPPWALKEANISDGICSNCAFEVKEQLKGMRR